MVLFLMLGLAAVCAAIALRGWRRGFLLMIFLAAVQDPLRKLVPGTPGWLVLLTAPVFVAAIFTSAARTRNWWSEFRRYNPSISRSMLLLALLSMPAAALSASYSSGSWMLTVLGAFSYSVIFLALVAGFHFVRNEFELRKMLALYCLCHGAMLGGAFIEYLHLLPGSRLIGSRALGYEWIRWGEGYTVDMIAGFYRSADVMGWHASAVCMLSIVLGSTGRSHRKVLWFLLALVAAAALLMCGRRKMVYMLPVFIACYGYLFFQAGRAAKVFALAGFLAIPVLSVGVVADWIGEGSANIRYYQGEGIQRTAWESVQAQGFTALKQTYRQSGFLGEGLGFATPGSHHIAVDRPRAWQESASSRILVELGVPGALGFLLVMFYAAIRLWQISISQLRTRTRHSTYVAGLVAFFMANVGSLAVSGQILADPFIASFLGFLVGVVLSAPKLGTRSAPASVRRTMPSMPDPMLHLQPVGAVERRMMEDLRLLPWQ